MHIRKWYTAGWLSLCLWPPVFICQLSLLSETDFKHTLPLTVFPPRSQPDNSFWKYNRLPDIWYENVRITEDKNQNRKLLQRVATKLHDIRLNENTNSGFLIEITSNASYGSFVEVIDLLHLMQWSCAVQVNNQIWVFFCLSRTELKNKFITAPTLQSVLKQLPQPDRFKTVWEVMGEKIVSGWRKKWPALFCFALLATLAKWYSCKTRIHRAKISGQTSLHSIGKDSEK